MRQFNFLIEVIAHDCEKPQFTLLEELIGLHLQELAYDDEFAAALGEKQAITVRTSYQNEVPFVQNPDDLLDFGNN